MSFETALAVADAVLLEGYALYPYRASAQKNVYRWTFGVLAPRAWSEDSGCEPWWLEAQCLLEPGRAAAVNGRLRFLHARRRRVEARSDDGSFGAVGALEVSGRLVVPWEEGDLREIDFEVPLASPAPRVPSPVPSPLEGEGWVGAGGPATSFDLPGGTRVEPVFAPEGREVGRVIHDQSAIRGRLCVEAEPVVAARPLVRVRVRVENDTPWPLSLTLPPQRGRKGGGSLSRAEALASGLLSTHLLLSADGGAFVSLLDPPPWAREAAAACRSTRVWPVLAGAPGRRDLVLAAPIILYDHPRVAPESPGDAFDATEIDELLALRTATLTEEEKREVRATDARAAAVLERAEGLTPEWLHRLHGAARGLSGGEMVPLAGASPAALPARLAPGRRVRLLAPTRRTDAQDLLHVGRTAIVRKIERDLDGEPQLAVTIEGDPAAELHEWYGRYHYYRLDEVEPVDDAGGAP